MSIKLLGRSLGWVMLLSLLTVNLMIGARLYSQEVAADGRDQAYDKIALFTRVIEQVRENYVDADKTSYESLVYGALKGMLQSLDPHSQFLDKDMYKDMKDDTSGQFGGLGIVISMKDNVLTIVAPMEDTPGFKAGLLAGDKIVEIDGKSTEGLTLQEAVKQLRGEPGTRVKLRILRPKSQEFKTVDIERANIEVASVKDARMMEDGIGYLRITTFSAPTADALQKELDKLMAQDLKALVIDLRNNPGGLLSSAIEVSQKFLKRNDVVVSTEGRNPKQDQTYRARGRKRYLDFPIAILVNSGSASASEIVAGALQDHRRAVLVGEKTFGKGSVQSVLPMDDDTAIRLTTAKYYTPSHKVIHERGIEPDIVVPMLPEDWRHIQIQRARPAGGEPVDDDAPVEPVEDVQLKRAADVLQGILKFARGGGAGPARGPRGRIGRRTRRPA
jgi:carboxyl-terminal processing protease